VTGDEVRAQFLKFFETKAHKVIPSSSLVPKGDPTLLLTSAGMVQIKPYFLGEAVPPSRRLASCQKCFRTTDIESVGDTTHLTFFEMLGNFSVGDYFKQEAIKWGWEFVTEWLKLPPERLWITIFLDDDESFNYWRQIGVPADRILRYGEKDNFWGPAGDSGPCGPCSEIHYDFGKEVGCGKDTCAPDCSCGRFSEIWNLVFTQYNQDVNGKRTPLPRPNIDTGMGLERTAAIMQGKTSVYQTDFFAPLLESLSGLTGKSYGSDKDIDHAMRVVVEHGRGITFLIGDGVMPGSEGTGYVLRRLLRRAALFGRRLGLDKPFLNELALTTIARMGHIYPEIKQKQDFILRVIESEESRFGETLNVGLQMLENWMAAGSGGKIPGEQAFSLYDTYGFPVELTVEIAAERGFTVDMDGFDKEMEKQRERARAAHRFGGEQKETTGLDRLDISETPFVGYRSVRHKSVVASLLVDGEPRETVAEGQPASLVLEETPFYAEMGGQVGDTGRISGANGQFAVTATVRTAGGIVVHEGYVAQGSLKPGDEVEAEVDEERRLDIARNHTATHLLQSALRQVLGKHVEQKGSLVAPERFRFDFSHLTALMPEELQEVQHIVNRRIRQNLIVHDEEIPYQQAIEQGAIALFDEKYGDLVRVIRIGEPAVSTELCGGTHIGATGEIGFFYIVGESSIGAGLRRIEAVTGRGAQEYIERVLEDAEDKVSALEKDLENEHRQVVALKKELAKKEAESLVGRAEAVNGVTLLVARVSPSRQEDLREMADLIRDKLKSAIVVLGTVYDNRPSFIAAVTPDLVDKGYDAGRIVKEVAVVTGGGGGGKAGLAQAGGKHKDKLDEALKLVRGLI